MEQAIQVFHGDATFLSCSVDHQYSVDSDSLLVALVCGVSSGVRPNQLVVAELSRKPARRARVSPGAAAALDGNLVDGVRWSDSVATRCRVGIVQRRCARARATPRRRPSSSWARCQAARPRSRRACASASSRRGRTSTRRRVLRAQRRGSALARGVLAPRRVGGGAHAADAWDAPRLAGGARATPSPPRAPTRRSSRAARRRRETAQRAHVQRACGARSSRGRAGARGARARRGGERARRARRRRRRRAARGALTSRVWCATARLEKGVRTRSSKASPSGRHGALAGCESRW